MNDQLQTLFKCIKKIFFTAFLFLNKTSFRGCANPLLLPDRQMLECVIVAGNDCVKKYFQFYFWVAGSV